VRSRTAFRRPRARGDARSIGGLPRWRRRLQPFLVGFVVLVCAGALAAQVYQQDPGSIADFLASMPQSASWMARQGPTPTLPDPTNRPYPAPGVEEAGAPLAAAPVIGAPSKQFRFSDTQTTSDGRTVPVTWSPCRPIHYVINPAGSPGGFTDQVVVAMADLSAATGLRFIADGVTAELPASRRASFQPQQYGDRWAPALIAFSDEESLPVLAGDIAGFGGYASSSDRATGLVHAVSGFVFLDRAVLAQPDVQGVPAYVPILRHELGHLVGLNHIDDPTQLMNPTTSAVITYQGGDLTGLAELGKGACAPDV